MEMGIWTSRTGVTAHHDDRIRDRGVVLEVHSTPSSVHAMLIRALVYEWTIKLQLPHFWIKSHSNSTWYFLWTADLETPARGIFLGIQNSAPVHIAESVNMGMDNLECILLVCCRGTSWNGETTVRRFDGRWIGWRRWRRWYWCGGWSCGETRGDAEAWGWRMGCILILILWTLDKCLTSYHGYEWTLQYPLLMFLWHGSFLFRYSPLRILPIPHIHRFLLIQKLILAPPSFNRITPTFPYCLLSEILQRFYRCTTIHLWKVKLWRLGGWRLCSICNKLYPESIWTMYGFLRLVVQFDLGSEIVDKEPSGFL